VAMEINGHASWRAFNFPQSQPNAVLRIRRMSARRVNAIWREGIAGKKGRLMWISLNWLNTTEAGIIKRSHRTRRFDNDKLRRGIAIASTRLSSLTALVKVNKTISA